jgi:hypothetical protein
MYPIIDILDVHHTSYKGGKNPIYVWYAVRKAISSRQSIPDWCGEYLLRVAENILDISEQYGQLYYLLGRTLEISKYHYNDLSKNDKKYKIYQLVSDKVDNGATVDSAIDDVTNEMSDHGLDTLGYESIKKYYYEVLAWVKEFKRLDWEMHIEQLQELEKESPE